MARACADGLCEFPLPFVLGHDFCVPTRLVGELLEIRVKCMLLYGSEVIKGLIVSFIPCFRDLYVYVCP